ncbi:antibiotic biosynthesis monooxygenase [Rhabdaerophilum sp. SD176]|uniref:antibiotic biosynthesis monooxygenase family protein n=1 Tax=Rhabdaerophilum sp. SD176 TaxID=2983548 RepID=UPI0024DFDE0F|nr:antibiotic biosynthesis monooxygenase [Rhabdaerophilum sp. SD176]
MIAVIFEVWPAEGERQTYLDLAAALRDELFQVDGFLTIERFQSLGEPDKLLSLSFWRDEAAVAAWRNSHAHRITQGRGRSGVFRDYRLRVAEVIRDYGLDERAEAPGDSRLAHGGSSQPAGRISRPGD